MIPHFLHGVTLNNLINLYKDNGVSNRYLHRSIYVAAISLLQTPISYLEHKLYDAEIHSTAIKSPVFIIGHWRCGTTFLHEILSQDQQFCYISHLQAMMPYTCILLNFIRYLKLKIKRPMDEIRVGPNSPQEDEFSLANMGNLSYYHGLFFFPNTHEAFLKYLTLSDASTSEIERIKNQIMFLYKKISFINRNKLLLSKNPPFTAKVKYLLQLFPDAKFIHIYRNPYTVYLSTVNMYKNMAKQFTFQGIPQDKHFEDIAFNNYCLLMKAFFSQQELIPSKNFVEIRYEDLVKHPLEHIEKIYTTLNIDGFAPLKETFQRYLNRCAGYEKNTHILSSAQSDKIYSRLSFAIDKWKYSPSD